MRVQQPGVGALLRALRRCARRPRGGGVDGDVHSPGAGREPRSARGPRRPRCCAHRPLGRRARGRDLPARGEPDDDRPLTRLRDLPRRRHRVAQARRLQRGGRPLADRGSGQPQRDLRQPGAGRDHGAERRRRAPDRQVPAHVPSALMTVTEATSRRLTIGTVCNRLKDEFPDVSISKIRYLEDQGLLNPRRTQGGYRLFSEDDVERLETILRLQRDEFLPLRVIREELAAGAGKERRRRRSAVGVGEEELDLEELCNRAGVTADRARQLEDFGLLESRVEDGQRVYAESEAEIAAACEALAQFGIDARNLRAFRTAADRESGLVEAVIAPALRSRNEERRQAALADLQRLAQSAEELADLLLRRNVRRLVE